MGSGESGTIRTSPNPLSSMIPPDVFIRKTEPGMTHLLAIAFAVVRQHVDNQQPAARLEHARHFDQRALGFGKVV